MTVDSEFRWAIDAYTPETIPMDRLAAYMGELARLLGESPAVHFVGLEEGSTVLVHRIAPEAVPKVRARTDAVRRNAGPGDARKAYRNINRMLREDNGTAVLREEGREIIRFPGREEEAEELAVVQEHGSIDGEILMVGGTADPVPVWLRSDGERLTGFSAARPIAKDLGKRLFETVRLFGTGQWNRDDQGAWKLDSFVIDRFETLSDAPLSSAVAALRAIPGGEWDEGSFDELHRIRYGEGGATE